MADYVILKGGDFDHPYSTAKSRPLIFPSKEFAEKARLPGDVVVPIEDLEMWWCLHDGEEARQAGDVVVAVEEWQPEFTWICEWCGAALPSSVPHCDCYDDSGEAAYLAQFEGMDSPQGMAYLEGRQEDGE